MVEEKEYSKYVRKIMDSLEDLSIIDQLDMIAVAYAAIAGTILQDCDKSSRELTEGCIKNQIEVMKRSIFEQTI